MALDVGTKRMGVALSDELFITAQGKETIRRTSLKADLEMINNIIKENDVKEIVVGLPLNMNGSFGPKAKEVLEFTDSLSKATNVPIKTWDERLTTSQVERVLIEADTSRAKRKGVIDMLAAQVILQSYLDSQKKGPTNA